MFHIICTFQRGTRVQPCRHKRLTFNPALRVPTRPRPDLHRAFQHSAMADARDHSRTPRRAYLMVTIKGRNPFRIWEDEVAEPKDVGALVDLVKNHKATARLQNIDAADLRLLLTNDASSQLDPLKPLAEISGAKSSDTALCIDYDDAPITSPQQVTHLSHLSSIFVVSSLPPLVTLV